MRRIICLAIAAAALAIPPAVAATPAAGTLAMRGTLVVVSTPVQCPPGVPSDGTECRARTGDGLLRGLGSVSETYTWSFGTGPPTCPGILTRPLATSGRLLVAGKGEIRFTLAEGTRCVDVEPVRNEPQSFTITGGTGPYTGASGSGTLQRSLGGGAGTETWTGTLAVPGVEFDMTPPTLRGATSRSVRAPRGAKRVRVVYAVTARDDADGAVPASCVPRSGSSFPIGRTVVTCSAADTSGNTATAKFTITVKPRR